MAFACLLSSRLLVEYIFRPGLDALSATREFTDEICHELATPLSFMQSEIQLISARHGNELRAEVDVLKDGVDRMGVLLDDIRVLISLDTYRRHPELSIIALDQLIREAITSFASDFELANIEVDYKGLKPVTVIADRDGLLRALSNLLKNALLYVPAGGMVKVILTRDEDYACISFSDDGNGMAPDELENIFDRFYRGQNAREAPIGTGLGLSIVKSTVDAHGGKVIATSSPGAGVEFNIRLPRYPSVHPLAFFISSAR